MQGRAVATALVLAMAALALAALASPAAAATSRSEFYGIVQTATLDNQDIQGMQDARVRTNRFVLKWGWVEPTNGTFKWNSSDDFIGSLAFHGIRAVPALWGNPGWVPGSGSTPPIGGTTSENQWRAFLRAMVARYGPGGTYWQAPYHSKFGANAKPFPVKAWQIWNEPNLKKFFAPYPSPGKYDRLLQISHDAIRSKDPKAQIVLAGMPAKGDVSASDFLKGIYSSQSTIKNFFDVAALHPYAPTISEMEQDIQKFRSVMKGNGDAATPLWITELAWGSATGGGINKGLSGQATMLKRAFNDILQHRTAWNVQRLFWYHWRDPQSSSASCTFCGSAGLLNYDRTTKPAYTEFTKFSADTTAPTATITSGPSNGAYIKDPTPTFSFNSSEAGSTFVCAVAPGPFKDCTSPYTLPQLSDGTHVFYVRAIDAAGNASPIVGRYFIVDTKPPATPTITGTNPASPANDNNPEVFGNSASGTTVRIYKGGCTGTPAAKGPASQFHSPGLTLSVPDNSTTSIRANATDKAGNVSGCSAAKTYVEDSTP